MLATIFEQFVQMSPVSVMARGLMERIFAPDRMNQLFARHAQSQHQQELLFSSQVALMRATLGSVHGVGKIDAGLSDFYLVDEIQGTYRGMMIAIPATHWQVFQTYSDEQMVLVLQQLAENVILKRFLKATRGAKKKRPPLIVNSQQRHVSTARLLETHQTLMKSQVRK